MDETDKKELRKIRFQQGITSSISQEEAQKVLLIIDVDFRVGEIEKGRES